MEGSSRPRQRVHDQEIIMAHTHGTIEQERTAASHGRATATPERIPERRDETKTARPHRGDGDDNPDPITGTPGSHPVGTGVGAASGGAAGAAVGAGRFGVSSARLPSARGVTATRQPLRNCSVSQWPWVSATTLTTSGSDRAYAVAVSIWRARSSGEEPSLACANRRAIAT
ncbi:MAG TPA: hypothetical protein VHQ65_06480, partial [Thermoanaerobaculia bacterium]|nr:hypothetical protein [Thermoanaerobaculia bacterium]